MYRVEECRTLTPVTRCLVIRAPEIARKAQAGQFVMVRTHEQGERIPLTIADADAAAGTVTIVVQEVGKTSRLVGALRPGEGLASLTGPLGRPTEIANYGNVTVVGGGLGIAAIYPIARALRSCGNHVTGIIGARSGDLLFWEEEMRAVTDELIVCTDDGSYARRALVTVPLKEALDRGDRIDRVWAIGPTMMMRFVASTTQPYATPTIVSLNSIMVDGTGMCGACRVSVGGRTRFACVDGPEFDGHQVDWNLLLARQRIYLDLEKRALDDYLARTATVRP